MSNRIWYHWLYLRLFSCQNIFNNYSLFPPSLYVNMPIAGTCEVIKISLAVTPQCVTVKKNGGIIHKHLWKSLFSNTQTNLCGKMQKCVWEDSSLSHSLTAPTQEKCVNPDITLRSVQSQPSDNMVLVIIIWMGKGLFCSSCWYTVTWGQIFCSVNVRGKEPSETNSL